MNVGFPCVNPTYEGDRTDTGDIKYVLATSGKSLDGSVAGDTIRIGEINYEVHKRNNGGAVNSSSLNFPDDFKPNDQHAEQKIMDYLSQYADQNINVTMSVQNVSNRNPGMCDTCQVTVPEFAKRHPNFNFIDIFQGTTGEGP